MKKRLIIILVLIIAMSVFKIISQDDKTKNILYGATKVTFDFKGNSLTEFNLFYNNIPIIGKVKTDSKGFIFYVNSSHTDLNIGENIITFDYSSIGSHPIFINEYKINYNGQPLLGKIEFDENRGTGLKKFDFTINEKKLIGTIKNNSLMKSVYDLQFGDIKITGEMSVNAKKTTYDVKFGNKSCKGDMLNNLDLKNMKGEGKLNILLENFTDEELLVFFIVLFLNC